jgi:hypothetical protein
MILMINKFILITKSLLAQNRERNKQQHTAQKQKIILKDSHSAGKW